MISSLTVLKSFFAVFFSFEMLNFKVPVLSEMGINLLVLFIFALVFNILAQFLVEGFRYILLAFPALDHASSWSSSYSNRSGHCEAIS